jgi:hypothetical protein
MKKILLFALVLVVLGGAWFAFLPKTRVTPSSDSTFVSNADDTAVRQVVTNFGTKLQTVSLLAPTKDRTASMEANYSRYVAPELLMKWFPEGSEALGRNTSSPWPDRINVVEVKQNGNNATAEGNVIEVTNGASTTEVAAVYPVTLTLEKRKGTWFIVNAVRGAYSEIPHSQAIVGFWECLPHKGDGPHTMECAFGIAKDQSDGHYAIDTSLMARYPVDYPTGTKVRVTGIVTPANQLSSVQKYDIDGIINATMIEEVTPTSDSNVPQGKLEVN